MTRRSAVAVVLAASGCSATATYLPARMNDVQPAKLSALSLGAGYDLIAGETRETCITSQGSGPIPSELSSVYTIDIVYSRSDLFKRMAVDASGSLSVFAGGGAAAARFASEQRFTHDSVYALVRVKLSAPTVVLKDVGMTDKARTLLSAVGGAVQFREACGDAYAYGIEQGADFYGVLRFEASSQTKQDEVAAAVRAKGRFWTAESDFSNVVKDLSQKYTVSVSIVQSGALPAILEDLKPEDLLKASRAFHTKFFTARPENMGVRNHLTMRYSGLILLEGLDVKPVVIDEPLDVMAKLKELALDAGGKLLDVDEVLADPKPYTAAELIALKATRSSLTAMNVLVTENAKRCWRDLSLCKLDPNLGVIEVVLPTPTAPKLCPVYPKGTDFYCGRKPVESCEQRCVGMDKVDKDPYQPAKVGPGVGGGKCSRVCNTVFVPTECRAERFGPAERFDPCPK